MAEITDRLRNLPRRKVLQLLPADAHRTAIGSFAQKHASQRRFTAGNRPGHADDLAGLRRKGQAGKDVLPALIGKGEVLRFHRLPGRDLQRRKLLRRFHQGLDALPGNFRALHRIEQLRRLGGFGRHFDKAGEKGRNRRDVPRAPARAQHVFCAEPEDEQHAQVRHHKIQRRQRGLPDVRAHSGALIAAQRLFVALFPRVLAAVDAVGHGIARAVERRGAERGSGLFICRTRALHGLFHPLRADIGNRREDHAQQRQPPIVDEQHHRIAHQRNAGIKNLCGEFAHALRTVVHIGNGLGYPFSRAFVFQFRTAAADQVGIEHAFHATVDVVGKAPHIIPLDEARRLHQQRHGDIRPDQHRHGRGGLIAAQDIGQALCHSALEPRPGEQTNVVDESRQRHKSQRQPFQPEIRADAVRLEGSFLIFPHELSPPAFP